MKIMYIYDELTDKNDDIIIMIMYIAVGYLVP